MEACIVKTLFAEAGVLWTYGLRWVHMRGDVGDVDRHARLTEDLARELRPRAEPLVRRVVDAVLFGLKYVRKQRREVARIGGRADLIAADGENFIGDTMILSIFYYYYHLLYTRAR